MSMASHGYKRLQYLHCGILRRMRVLQRLTERGKRCPNRPITTPLVAFEAFEPRLLLNGVLTAVGANVGSVEGASSGTVTVANFTDADTGAQTSDYTATITWQTGVTSPGTFVHNLDGSFSVQGTHTYAEAGSYPIGVSIVDGAGTYTTSSTATVSDAALTVGTLTSTVATEGVPFSVFHFTDAAGAYANIADYTAVVTLPNSNTMPLTSTATANEGEIVPSGDGFDVRLSSIFAAMSNSPATYAVTVSDSGGASPISGSATITVVDAPLTAGTLSAPSPIRGLPIINAVLFHFADANFLAKPGDFTATVAWGDGTSDSSDDWTQYVSVVPDAGGFDVVGTHTYSTAGTGLTFSVSVADDDGSSIPAQTATIDVINPVLTAQGVYMARDNVSEPFSGVLATFTDNAGAHGYSASIDWGDGNITDADHVYFDSVTGTGRVTGTHTYSSAVSHTVQVTITDTDSDTFTTTVTATICPTLDDLQSAIASTPTGCTLDLGTGSWTAHVGDDVLTIGHQMTLLHGTIHSLPNLSGLWITSSDVTVDGLTVIGPQDTEYHGYGSAWDSEMGIIAADEYTISGQSNTYYHQIANITIRNCHISNLGDQGIALVDVNNFTITGNTITDVKLAGIAVGSGLMYEAPDGVNEGSTQGTISYNDVERIDADPASTSHGENSWGIILGSDDTGTKVFETSYVTVDHNYVADVPWWEGLDEHGCDHVTWSNNTVRRVMYGLMAGTAGSSRPHDITVNDNHFDSPSPVFYRPADAIELNGVDNSVFLGNEISGWKNGWADQNFYPLQTNSTHPYIPSAGPTNILVDPYNDDPNTVLSYPQSVDAGGLSDLRVNTIRGDASNSFAFSGLVATFRYTGGALPPGTLAIIHWTPDDQSIYWPNPDPQNPESESNPNNPRSQNWDYDLYSLGTIVADGGGSYSVYGTHTYVDGSLHTPGVCVGYDTYNLAYTKTTPVWSAHNLSSAGVVTVAGTDAGVVLLAPTVSMTSYAGPVTNGTPITVIGKAARYEGTSVYLLTYHWEVYKFVNGVKTDCDFSVADYGPGSVLNPMENCPDAGNNPHAEQRITFTPTDSGPYIVQLTVSDDYLAAGDYDPYIYADPTATQTVEQIITDGDVTATISNNSDNGQVDPGGTVTVSFADAHDSSDPSATFRYSFATSRDGLAKQYSDASVTASENTIPFNQSGRYTVYGRVFDQDGDFSDYTTTVWVTSALNGAVRTLDALADTEYDDVIVAHFDEPGAGRSMSDYAATITWSAGSTPDESATIEADPNGGFVVKGSHTYATSGCFVLSVTIYEIANPYNTVTLTADKYDLNGDGLVNATDIDLLYATIRGASQNPGAPTYPCDLNGDGIVNQVDTNILVTTILYTEYGDANLDWYVDFIDAQALWDNWNGDGGWAQGDFNGDGTPDFLDFQILLDRWNPGGSGYYSINGQGNTLTGAVGTDLNNVVVGSFTDVNNIDMLTEIAPGIPLYNMSSIDWGDGTTSPCTLQATGSGSFNVIATKPGGYSNAGAYDITITINTYPFQVATIIPSTITVS